MISKSTRRIGPFRRSAAFTLVELLVVIAIIGVLAALMLPAVQSVRESGRRVQCMNNIRQLTMGCLQHEVAQRHFPTGGWNWYWAGDPDLGFRKNQPGGWTYTVLPFIEQKNLFELGTGMNLANKKVAFQKRGSSPLSVFYCPTRRKSHALLNAYHDCNANPVSQAARSDYAANTGVNQVAWWNVTTSGNPAFAKAPGFKFPVFRDKGVIYCLSTTTTAEITDGLSQTYLIGEKYLNADNYTNSKEGTDNNPTYAGFDWDWQRWAGNGLLHDRKGRSDWVSFGSAHPTGANMSFCDGSVKYIVFGVDAATHRRLCDREDRELVDASKY